MALINHIDDLPVEIKNEIMNWYNNTRGSMIAYVDRKCYTTYGPTPTRDLLLMAAECYTLIAFEELESYFDYRILEHPKELFVSAIRGNNIQFIVDFINTGRGSPSLIVDPLGNISAYILTAIGKWTHLQTLLSLIDKFIPQGYPNEWTIVFQLRIALIGAMSVANYPFIEETVMYLATNVTCAIPYAGLYRIAINTHNGRILDIIESYWNPENESIKRRLDNMLTVEQMCSAPITQEFIDRLARRGINISMRQIIYNAIRYPNIAMLDLALASDYEYAGDGVLFRAIVTNKQLDAFKYYFDNNRTQIIKDGYILGPQNVVYPALREYITLKLYGKITYVNQYITEPVSLIKMLKTMKSNPVHHIQWAMYNKKWKKLSDCPNHNRCHTAYICLRWMRKTMSAEEVQDKLRKPAARNRSSAGLYFFCYYIGLPQGAPCGDDVRLNYQIAIRQLLGLPSK